MIRLQAALKQPAPPGYAAQTVTVTQEAATNVGDPLIGPTAVIFPTPAGPAVNPNPLSLATIPQVWGYRRDLWTQQTAGLLGSTAADQSFYVPVSVEHEAASWDARGICGMHFVHTGQRFEILFAGVTPVITLIADGNYAAPQTIETALSNGAEGAPLSSGNAWVQFDFGTRATRQISVYATSTQGPCALAVDAQDTVTPWDRSAEPSFCVMADSYGQRESQNWGGSGPFWEAAALLGIPHVDADAIGGTGYAPNNTNADYRNPLNAFDARLATCTVHQPDLFLTCGGINDNNWEATPPLYTTAAQALAAFNQAVAQYYVDLRAALPNAVLAATGPWAPVQSIPTDPVAQSKLNTIKAALAAVGGPWVFMDNLNGGWLNSAGATGNLSEGPWQTGTGNVGDPKGDGNGDIYVSADGTHPTIAGCVYLGQKIAASVRAGITAL